MDDDFQFLREHAKKIRKESIPNALIRSSLFGVNRSSSGQIIKKKIPSLSNYDITYIGEELGQSDCQIFYFLMRAYRSGKKRTDGFVEIKQSDILESLGVSKGGSAYDWLWTHLERLKRAEISVVSDRYKYLGNLVSEVEKNDANGTIAFVMNNKLASVNGDYTAIDLQRKVSIKSLIGKWAHDFYSSHAFTIPMKLDTIKSLTGSKLEKAKFKSQLKIAMEEIKNAGVVNSYRFDGDTLIVGKERKQKKENKNDIR